MRINKSGLLYFLRISGVLTLITMCVAFLLSFVNGVTKDVIARNEAEKTAAAVAGLFPPAEAPVSEALNVGNDIGCLDAFYSVKDGEELIGYYAEVSPVGFKGEVKLIVGIDKDGRVCGVSVLSHSETVGIGDKALGNEHLDKFIGFYEGGEGIDDVSGATYTSRAVSEGVDAALGADSRASG